jgi:hypothetical protein
MHYLRVLTELKNISALTWYLFPTPIAWEIPNWAMRYLNSSLSAKIKIKYFSLCKFYYVDLLPRPHQIFKRRLRYVINCSPFKYGNDRPFFLHGFEMHICNYRSGWQIPFEWLVVDARGTTLNYKIHFLLIIRIYNKCIIVGIRLFWGQPLELLKTANS